MEEEAAAGAPPPPINTCIISAPDEFTRITLNPGLNSNMHHLQISRSLTFFVIITASLALFLPAAISMNTQVVSAVSQDTNIFIVLPEIPADNAAAKNKKGSLSLETAAIVGSSPASTAAVLAGRRKASVVTE